MNSLRNKLCKSNFISLWSSSHTKFLEKFQQPTVVSTRSTFILKRKYPVPLRKKHLEHVDVHKFKGKDFIYELVQNTEMKKPDKIPIILREFIQGVGEKGECVYLQKYRAYNKLIITGLADYATPEAIENAEKMKALNPTKTYSSMTAPLVVKYLESKLISVIMNKDVEWTIEKWHIHTSFRKGGVHVPEHCIQLPEKLIKGPNLDLEGKYFLVVVTINGREKVTVRCRIHHWSSNPSNRLPYVENPWTLPQEAIFPEDNEKLKELPVIEFKKI